MPYNEFANVHRNALRQQSKHIVRDVQVGSGVGAWVAQSAYQINTSETNILNDAVLLGSARILAAQYTMECYLEDSNKKEVELSTRTNTTRPPDPELIKFSLNGYENQFAHFALLDAEAPLEQVVQEGVNVLGRMACDPYLGFVVSRGRTHSRDGHSFVPYRWAPPLRVVYENADPYEETA